MVARKVRPVCGTARGAKGTQRAVEVGADHQRSRRQRQQAEGEMGLAVGGDARLELLGHGRTSNGAGGNGCEQREEEEQGAVHCGARQLSGRAAESRLVAGAARLDALARGGLAEAALALGGAGAGGAGDLEQVALRAVAVGDAVLAVAVLRARAAHQIGRASCRERV